MPGSLATPPPERALSADCAACTGLCCVALAFARSADFAFDKAAGEECVNLGDDFLCRIHPHQHVTQHTFDGASWRDGEPVRTEMFAVFPIVRQLHELLWYLREALAMPAAAALHPALRTSWNEVTAAADAAPEAILHLDIDVLRDPAAELLREAARLTRESGPRADARARLRVPRTRLVPGADLLGADLRGADLRGAELRGALLIAADLREADLTRAELIGADLRDAQLHGARLERAIYLTQPQVDAARGDSRTRLPAALRRPSHWD